MVDLFYEDIVSVTMPLQHDRTLLTDLIESRPVIVCLLCADNQLALKKHKSPKVPPQSHLFYQLNDLGENEISPRAVPR